MENTILSWDDILKLFKTSFHILFSDLISKPPCAWRLKEAIHIFSMPII